MCACVRISGEQHVCVNRLFYDITNMCERAGMYARMRVSHSVAYNGLFTRSGKLNTGGAL